MIQVQLKLRMTKAQERECERWLFHLTSVWNWGLRKIELNANDKIYFSRFDFKGLVVGHSVKLGIPSHVQRGGIYQGPGGQKLYGDGREVSITSMPEGYCYEHHCYSPCTFCTTEDDVAPSVPEATNY